MNESCDRCCLVATETLAQLVYDNAHNALLLVENHGAMARLESLLASSVLFQVGVMSHLVSSVR